MNNERISLAADGLEEQALQYFYHASGLKKGETKERLLLSEAMGIGDRMKKEIKVRALASSFSRVIPAGDQLRMGDVTLQSPDFHLLAGSSPKTVYAYLLTVEDVPQEEKDSLFTQYFIDIWANAYVNSGLQALADAFLARHLKENQEEHGQVLLRHFSPGLGAMDIAEVDKLFHLLDGSKINITLTDSHTMLPMKSHGGFFIADYSTEGDVSMKPHHLYCLDCKLDNEGCRLCVHYNSRQQE